MTLVTLRAEWYTDASADLNLVMPSVRSRLEAGWHGDFVSSTGPWPEEGHWESAQAFSLPIDEVGTRYRPTDNHAETTRLQNWDKQGLQIYIRCLPTAFETHPRSFVVQSAAGAFAGKRLREECIDLGQGVPTGTSNPCFFGLGHPVCNRAAFCCLFIGDWFPGH